MVEFQNTDLRDAIEAELPDGYVISKDVVFPDKEIPIKAEINGQKVVVGSGRVDTETGIFTGKLDDEPYGEIMRGKIEDGSFSYNPFLNVSELELSQAHQIVNALVHSISLDSKPGPYGGVIEKVTVFPNGHAIIEPEEEEPDGPTPRFHDHD